LGKDEYLVFEEGVRHECTSRRFFAIVAVADKESEGFSGYLVFY
jgi:hypothetical protein